MTRSPDDIFAAQFWAWPDPALKRDAYGRVIFVNAAFLQLFGGRVEAWQGQVIEGWSAPQPGPEPYRFEIRTPASDAYPEQVYDWLESCGPDGSGFAIARNVTVFIQEQQAAPAPQPAQSHWAASEPPQSRAAAPQEQTLEVAPAAPEPQPQEPQPPELQPREPAPHTSSPPDLSGYVEAASANPHAQPEPQQAPTPHASPDPVMVAPATQQPAAQAPIATQSSEPAASPQASATLLEVNPHDNAPAQSREFERRALPIESDGAVLGNNWRDAVIAKAIGGEDDSSPAADGPADPAKPDAIHILLAEDNAINALLTRTLLEADGHTVETVEDGMLAVEAMKRQDFDMIFMDMRMPNMDGLEATRKIRGLPNVSKDLPIVALTANAFDDDRNACFDSGMNDFMTKPVSAEELSEMVLRWTTQREQRMAG